MKQPKYLTYNSTEILEDFKLCILSRQASIMGRQEVMGGKAKFGIFGDGKELPQVALAKIFKNGDFRSGYYRDQTLMLAIKQLTIKQLFSQLYANPDSTQEPASSGRMMNNHFGTPLLDVNGRWLDLTSRKNSSSDISPNASQIPRLLGLAYASKLYRGNKNFDSTKFSKNGNEIAFGTIGNAATSEGMFWESVNAAGVLAIPMHISVWDDGYGISVANEVHTIKESISKCLKGFQKNDDSNGLEIFEVCGWNYPELVKVYKKSEAICRKYHIPVLVHVTELTQPQGHSTSGSHERYKPAKRLDWEKKYDCILKFREWILDNEILTETQLSKAEQDCNAQVQKSQIEAAKELLTQFELEKKSLIKALENSSFDQYDTLAQEFIDELKGSDAINRSLLFKKAKTFQFQTYNSNFLEKQKFQSWIDSKKKEYDTIYSSNLYSESTLSALRVKEVDPIYENKKYAQGFKIINICFDNILATYPNTFVIGEDVGFLGDVNQGLAGLQKKYGNLRVTDTSIRECTIIGQAIGAAMRGLRPIAEIQYLDYLNYALQILSDDLACLRYRTNGKQKAPVIIRTRGHRLEGIWHSGSYLSSILNAVRGIYVLCPRNFVQASGMYNTMMQSDDSAIIIERLNAYRIKELVPNNLKTFTLPLGVPDVLMEGADVTIVTYGAMCDIALEAATMLHEYNISCEIIDVQTLLPFDVHNMILHSIKKTNKVAFLDEDVPGGATAYMLQKVLEEQGGFDYLDEMPITITSKEYRPPYGNDGNFFSKPNAIEIVQKIANMMNKNSPSTFPYVF